MPRKQARDELDARRVREAACFGVRYFRVGWLPLSARGIGSLKTSITVFMHPSAQAQAIGRLRAGSMLEATMFNFPELNSPLSEPTLDRHASSGWVELLRPHQGGYAALTGLAPIGLGHAPPKLSPHPVLKHLSPLPPLVASVFKHRSAALAALGIQGDGLYTLAPRLKGEVLGRMDGRDLGRCGSRANRRALLPRILAGADKLCTYSPAPGASERDYDCAQGASLLQYANDPCGTPWESNIRLDAGGWMHIIADCIPGFGEDAAQSELLWSYGSRYWEVAAARQAARAAGHGCAVSDILEGLLSEPEGTGAPPRMRAPLDEVARWRYRHKVRRSLQLQRRRPK